MKMMHGRVLLGLLEHVAHAGAPTPTNISTKSEPEIEKNGTLASPAMALASRVLPVPGLPTISTPLGMRPAQLLELGGIAQEIDQFGDFFLGFVAAGDVGEGDGVGRLVEHARARLAEGEGAALAAALHLAHEEDPDADQQQHREPGDEEIHQEGLLFFGLGLDLDAVLEQVADHPQVGRRVGDDRLPSVVVAFSVRPWITTLAMRPAFTSSRNCEYSSVFCATWRVLNWLKTVISTRPITSQIARFLKRLFKLSSLARQGPQTTIYHCCILSFAARCKRQSCRDYPSRDWGRQPVPSRYTSLLRSREQTFGLRTTTLSNAPPPSRSLAESLESAALEGLTRKLPPVSSARRQIPAPVRPDA
jgi:hypothetical protein